MGTRGVRSLSRKLEHTNRALIRTSWLRRRVQWHSKAKSLNRTQKRTIRSQREIVLMLHRCDDITTTILCDSWDVERVAIVPARGGSQRIPQKNIKDFFGIPILTRTIKIIMNSQCFDRIVVSTDHEKIADVALHSGAEVPFLRSQVLSENRTPTVDVIADAIHRLNLNNADSVCCIYATNPFLREDALRLGHELLLNSSDVSYVTTVTTFPFPIQRALKIQKDGKLRMANIEYMMSHSQDLEERYHECAQFWWASASTWLSKVGMQTNVAGIYLPRWMVQDIDTLEDWDTAEIKFKILKESGRFDTYNVSADNILKK